MAGKWIPLYLHPRAYQLQPLKTEMYGYIKMRNAQKLFIEINDKKLVEFVLESLKNME